MIAFNSLNLANPYSAFALIVVLLFGVDTWNSIVWGHTRKNLESFKPTKEHDDAD